MSKTLNLKSKFLESLNKTLQELSLKESITILESPTMGEDGNFKSVVQTLNDIDTKALDKNIVVDDIENKKQEETQQKKKQLKDLVIDKIKETLTVSDELQALLNDIDKLNKEDHSKEWIANNEDNTAILADKDMRIFKQNDKLCLSHNGKVELFNTVDELHNWLREHNTHLPKDIAIHESIDESSIAQKINDVDHAPDLDLDYIGKWNQIIDTGIDTDKQIGNTQSPEEFKKELDAEQNRQDAKQVFFKGLLPTKAANKLYDKEYGKNKIKTLSTQDECTTTANLGAPMQYTAIKENELEEAKNQVLATSLERLKRALNGDTAIESKMLKSFYDHTKNNSNYENIANSTETLTNVENKKVLDMAVSNPDNADLFIAAINTLIKNSSDSFISDIERLINGYYTISKTDSHAKQKYLEALGFNNLRAQGQNFAYNSDIDRIVALEKYFDRFNSVDELHAALDTSDNYERNMSIIRNQGNNNFHTKWNMEIHNLDNSFAITRSPTVRNAYEAESEEHKRIVDHAFKNTIAAIRQDFPMIPAYDTYEDYVTHPSVIVKNADGNPVKGTYDLYYASAQKALNKNTGINMGANKQSGLTKNKLMTDKILKQLETEKPAIDTAIDTDRRIKFAVNGWLNELLTQSDKNQVINDLLTASPKEVTKAIKKAVLLKALEKGIELTDENLEAYAQNIGLDLGNASKFMQQSDIENTLKQLNASPFIAQVKKAIAPTIQAQVPSDVITFDDETPVDTRSTDEKQFATIERLKAGKAAGKFPQGLLGATASAILQDKKIDTSKTKEAWEALLGEATNKSFKEKMAILKEALFKEDETPADFATGNDSTITPDSDPVDTPSVDISSSDLNDTADQDSTFDTTKSKDPVNFGDININANGFDPDEYGPEDTENGEMGLPVPTEEFTIEDVLVNENDKTDIRLKLKNTTTGKIITKPLSEVDV